MKKQAKQLVVRILQWQLERLRSKHDITVIAVAGSVGKTSTKMTVANVLRHYCKVLVQEGNYNVDVTVPLVFFGRQNPPLVTNPLAWMKIFIQNEFMLLGNYPYELVVVELGTDGPGQMKQFKKLIQADIGILTSIGPEHMEFFKSIDAVATEELVIADIADRVIVNSDDVAIKYAKKIKDRVTYGTSMPTDILVTGNGQKVVLHSGHGKLTFESQIVGSHLQKAYGAAYAVCVLLGIDVDDSKAKKAFASIQAVSGRMQLLEGKMGSVLIDDTYNNVSSEPAIAALNALYEQPQKRKIAVLGNMNELGDYTQEHHEKVGSYCDPKLLSEVLTIGPDANTVLSEAALKNKNKVTTFESPYEIATYLLKRLDKNTVVLFKGSQNRVYLEEAIKPLLAKSSDKKKLVRQSSSWIDKKQQHFKNG